MINKIVSKTIDMHVDSYTASLVVFAIFLSLLYIRISLYLIIIFSIFGLVVCFIEGMTIKNKEYFIRALCLVFIGAFYFGISVDLWSAFVTAICIILVLAVFYSRYSRINLQNTIE